MEDVSCTFLIIGGGIAGVTCAEVLMQKCPEESTILLSASSLVKSVTNVSQIAQLLTSFDVEEESTLDFQSRCNPNLRVFVEYVTDIHSVSKFVKTASGRKFYYEKLCLCHGARPKLLADNHDFILGIRDTESVFKFQDRLKRARRIAVIGNGGIATELVHELRNVDILWAVKDDSISAAFVDAGAGKFFVDVLTARSSEKQEEAVKKPVKRMRYTVSDHHRRTEFEGPALGEDWKSKISVIGQESSKKVQVEYEVEVTDVWTRKEFTGKRESVLTRLRNEEEDGKWNVYLRLSNGLIFGCDFVVSATGVIPNGDSIRFLDDEKLATGEDGGILVDELMRTSVTDIFAAGDVCRVAWKNPAPHWTQMRLWTQARQMGFFVGECMIASLKGDPDEDENYIPLNFCFELFTHVTKFFGFKVILLGLFNAQGLDTSEYEVWLRVTKGQEYIKVIVKDERMQGAVLIGETGLEETFENLILNQMNLSGVGVDLLDPDIDIDDYFD